MLDFKLFTFLKVIELKSYTAAAKELHLTQPAVTQHIKKLEEYYGCRLIDSSSRSANPTEAGMLLYHYVCVERANERQFMDSLQKISVPLHIGATLSIADYYLPEILTRTLLGAESHFNVTVGNTERLLGELMSGHLDCAFVEGIFDASLFDANVFREARFLPVAARNHPLAGKSISLRQLHSYPLALRESGSGTREVLSAYLSLHNDSIHTFPHIIELGSFVLIKQLLAHSDAISFVYEAVAAQEVSRGELCFLDIEDYSFTHPLVFLYRKNSIMHKLYETFYETVMCDSGKK